MCHAGSRLGTGVADRFGAAATEVSDTFPLIDASNAATHSGAVSMSMSMNFLSSRNGGTLSSPPNMTGNNICRLDAVDHLSECTLELGLHPRFGDGYRGQENEEFLCIVHARGDLAKEAVAACDLKDVNPARHAGEFHFQFGFDLQHSRLVFGSMAQEYPRVWLGACSGVQ